MAVPNIHIMPIKRFISAPDIPKGAVAIMSSSEQIDESRVKIPFVVAYYQDLDYEDPRAFSLAQAKTFAEYIKSLDTNVTDIYVCCQAGESRSPGLAAAVYHYYGLDPHDVFRNPKYHPNVLCFRLLTEALGVPVEDVLIDQLIYENQQAFKLAIKNARK